MVLEYTMISEYSQQIDMRENGLKEVEKGWAFSIIQVGKGMKESINMDLKMELEYCLRKKPGLKGSGREGRKMGWDSHFTKMGVILRQNSEMISLLER